MIAPYRASPLTCRPAALLHDFARAFARTIQVGFVNDVQLEALFIPCGMIELEL